MYQLIQINSLANIKKVVVLPESNVIDTESTDYWRSLTVWAEKFNKGCAAHIHYMVEV